MLLTQRRSGFNASSKANLFSFCLAFLQIEDQYRFLLELCKDPPTTSKKLPNETVIQELLIKLFASGSESGLTLRAPHISHWKIKAAWIKVASRIEKKPDAAITAARSMLENTCKIILSSFGVENDAFQNEGILEKLVKETRKRLNINSSIQQITGGFSSLINGIASTSNMAGDRHGIGILGSSVPIADARLICDLCYSLSLYFLDVFTVSKNSNLEQEDVLCCDEAPQ